MRWLGPTHCHPWSANETPQGTKGLFPRALRAGTATTAHPPSIFLGALTMFSRPKLFQETVPTSLGLVSPKNQGGQQRESVPFSTALQGARGGRQKAEPRWEDGADWVTVTFGSALQRQLAFIRGQGRIPPPSR